MPLSAASPPFVPVYDLSTSSRTTPSTPTKPPRSSASASPSVNNQSSVPSSPAAIIQSMLGVGINDIAPGINALNGAAQPASIAAMAAELGSGSTNGTGSNGTAGVGGGLTASPPYGGINNNAGVASLNSSATGVTGSDLELSDLELALDEEDLGALLFEFFTWYGCQFDFQTMGIAVAPPSQALEAPMFHNYGASSGFGHTNGNSNGISNTNSNTTAATPTSGFSNLMSSPLFFTLPSPSRTLVISDPFYPLMANNIGRSVFAMWRIKLAFEEGLKLLKEKHRHTQTAPTLLSRIITGMTEQKPNVVGNGGTNTTGNGNVGGGGQHSISQQTPQHAFYPPPSYPNHSHHVYHSPNQNQYHSTGGHHSIPRHSLDY